jgi:hypothetical protein
MNRSSGRPDSRRRHLACSALKLSSDRSTSNSVSTGRFISPSTRAEPIEPPAPVIIIVWPHTDSFHSIQDGDRCSRSRKRVQSIAWGAFDAKEVAPDRLCSEYIYGIGQERTLDLRDLTRNWYIECRIQDENRFRRKTVQTLTESREHLVQIAHRRDCCVNGTTVSLSAFP